MNYVNQSQNTYKTQLTQLETRNTMLQQQISMKNQHIEEKIKNHDCYQEKIICLERKLNDTEFQCHTKLIKSEEEHKLALK